MKDTVEVRLQVPRHLHEIIKRHAEANLRTTHNEYLATLWRVLETPSIEPKRWQKQDYEGPG